MQRRSLHRRGFAFLSAPQRRYLYGPLVGQELIDSIDKQGEWTEDEFELEAKILAMAEVDRDHRSWEGGHDNGPLQKFFFCKINVICISTEAAFWPVNASRIDGS